jgi:hypothetical protein
MPMPKFTTDKSGIHVTAVSVPPALYEPPTI